MDAAAREGVDLHFHILPGLDDGPEDMAASLALARAAVADGTGTVVVTPHVRSDFVTDVRSLPERVRELRDALEWEGIPLELYCGGELGADMVGRLGQRELETIAQGPPGARWLLLESPFEAMGEDFHAAAAELRDRGFGVLLGHPERSPDAELDDSAGLRWELVAGSLAQLNALSLTGGHGTGAEWAAFELVRGGLAAVVASDAHGPLRPPALRAARRALVHRGIAPDRARAITQGSPRRLLVRGIRPAGSLVA